MTEDRARLAGLVSATRPVTWVLTGDSITHGLIHTRGARSYVEHLHELIRGDLGRVQDVMINTAGTGWRADLILENFDRRVAAWRPDVVTLMVGTNDCSTEWVQPSVPALEFSESVRSFVERVRLLDAIPILQTPPTVDLLRAPDRERIGEFAQMVRDVAGAEDAILVDQHTAFSDFARGTGPGNEGHPWGLLDDAFHPNAAGHALLALELAATLGLDPGDAGSRVLTDLQARVAVARHPPWPPS